MNSRISRCFGFTLFELVAVTAILGLVLFFAVPRFQAFRYFSETSDPVSMIMLQINTLKKRSVADNTDYVMHIQASTRKLWITPATATDEEIESAKEQALEVSEDVTIVDVAYPPDTGSHGEPYPLQFSRHGHSDRALIHLRSNGVDITLRLEPFLPSMERVDRYVSFETCN